MKTNNEQYENLKKKLLKLQALAEQGYKGEAENARRAIERICKQYGLKLEDILDIKTKHLYTFEIGRKKEMMNLFIRCLSAVCDTSNMYYWRLTRSSIKIELTALQYAEVASLFDWHKANYNRELAEFKSSFMSAYIGKHNLFFNEERNGNVSDELTQEDIERIRRVWKMREAMSDNTYRKQLEEKL